ncbi:MAG: transposase [Ktedonobacteraceae bacterium]|nr:transposase [Ktedonobacteraceae bacterium]
MLLRRPKELSERDIFYLHALSRLSPEMVAAPQLAQRFVVMIQQRQKDELDDWLDTACRCSLQPICRFALGLHHERDAVRATLQEPWSTCPSGGTNNPSQVSQVPNVRRMECEDEQRSNFCVFVYCTPPELLTKS